MNNEKELIKEVSLNFKLGENISLISVSNGMKSVLGYSAEEFINGSVTFIDRLHKDDADIANVLFQNQITSQEETANIRLRHQDGRIRCIKVSYSKYLDDKNNFIVLNLLLQDAKTLPRTMNNITNVAELSVMMENTDDYIYFKDQNHVFTGASKTLVSLCDPSDEWRDLLGRTDYDVFSEELADIYYKLEKEVFSGKAVAHEIQSTISKDKVEGWVDNRKYPITNSSNEIIGLYGIARDITKEKQLQIELINEKKLLEEAQKIAHLGSWQWNTEDNSLIWSDEVFRIFGEEPQSFKPTFEKFLSYLEKEEQEEIQKVISESIELNQAYYFEHSIICKNGTKRYVQESGNVFYNEHGVAVSMIGTVLDITERKKAETTLKIQSKMAQMGEMISMIAHQWRQPLQNISVITINMKLVSLLEEYNLAEEKGSKEYESYINDEIEKIGLLVKNLTATIDDFRNFYKKDKESNSLTLDSVVIKSLNIIKDSLKSKGISLSEEYHSSEPVELFDSEFMQVILNILKNAEDNFVERAVKEAHIKIVTGDRSISICDNGGGIPDNILDRIFDPYFSTKSEKNGTGLGLYMSKIIIEQHHKGKLTVENINDGVCFKIIL